MRIHIAQAFDKNAIIELFDESFHYLKNVMRVKNGDNIYIFNENSELLCKVLEIYKKSIILSVISDTGKHEKQSKIHFLPCIIKGDKMCEICDVAVQFGVNSIQPVISQNCYIKEINEKRMQAALTSALQQSGGMLPTILKNPIKIREIPSLIGQNDCIVYGDLFGACKQSKSLEKYDKIFALIGPEGGITSDETQMLASIQNSLGIRLSDRILRAENATCAILEAIFLMS